MARIKKDRLDELISRSGIGADAAAKLRAANESAETAPRGHGSAQAEVLTLDEV